MGNAYELNYKTKAPSWARTAKHSRVSAKSAMRKFVSSRRLPSQSCLTQAHCSTTFVACVCKSNLSYTKMLSKIFGYVFIAHGTLLIVDDCS